MPAKKSMTKQVVNDRAKRFLKVLIERYIQDGEPVGSRTLAKDASIDLSPATIRNVMSDLEDKGLIASPHKSAGRIPTVNGYRMFVDSLLSVQTLNQPDLQQLQSELNVTDDFQGLLASTSNMLSSMTHMAGVVMLPNKNNVSFRQIDFIDLSPNRVLAILVTSEGEVINRVIHPKRQYSSSELVQAANYLTHMYAGNTLSSIKDKIVQDMHRTQHDMTHIMSHAVDMGGQVFEETGDEGQDCLIAGQTNLMDFNDFADMGRLKSLFTAFTEKNEILHLLDECMQADGIQIFIGSESGYDTLNKCSVITSPYCLDGKVAGVLGVIGPTRMSYDKVIPIVDVTAKLLSAALKDR